MTRVISADSHLELPTDRWVHLVPERHRDRAPRRIRIGNGGDAWLVEGRPLRICGLELTGKPYEEYEPTGVRYDDSVGTGDPAQRLAEQDRDGVHAEVLFPGVGGPNFWRGIADDEAYLAVIRAYNDFLAQEYCAQAPDRLIGMGVIPETGIEDAVGELKRCASMGLKGVVLNAFPSGLNRPSPDDDRFWESALDEGIALTVHVALKFMAGGNRGLSFDYERVPADLGPGLNDPLKRMATWSLGGGLNAFQMVMDGVFERFPNLEIFFAENQIGWIPHFLEQLDSLYDRNIHWSRRYFGLRAIDGKPSDQIRRHCSWGFMHNRIGVKLRHEIGVERVMWSNDFPHSDSDWPRSREVIDYLFGDVPDDERRMMLAGNADRYFHLSDGS